MSAAYSLQAQEKALASLKLSNLKSQALDTEAEMFQ